MEPGQLLSSSQLQVATPRATDDGIGISYINIYTSAPQSEKSTWKAETENLEFLALLNKRNKNRLPPRQNLPRFPLDLGLKETLPPLDPDQPRRDQHDVGPLRRRARPHGLQEPRLEPARHHGDPARREHAALVIQHHDLGHGVVQQRRHHSTVAHARPAAELGAQGDERADFADQAWVGFLDGAWSGCAGCWRGRLRRGGVEDDVGRNCTGVVEHARDETVFRSRAQAAGQGLGNDEFRVAVARGRREVGGTPGDRAEVGDLGRVGLLVGSV